MLLRAYLTHFKRNHQGNFSNSITRLCIYYTWFALYCSVGASALKMFHSNPPMQRSATLAFLEGRVETCVALNSVSEYKYWLLMYIR